MIKLVHGTRSQRTVGLLRASFILLRDLWCGYCHTLTTRPDYGTIVKVVHRDGKDLMIFEVDMSYYQKHT